MTETLRAGAFRLPPLILHPFSTPEDATVLMQSSRASLALQGFAPVEEGSAPELERSLLRGRYAELRMLCYIGKDLTRWMDQCAEMTAEAFVGRRIRPETFGIYLIEHIPVPVRAKLEAWGVLDYRVLFRRAIGLHAVFADIPPVESISQDFLRRYHRYVDQWYKQRLEESGCYQPQLGDFVFDLYASGEYTLLLEQSWK